MQEEYIQDKIQNLIEKYKKQLRGIINPEGYTEWEDVGLDGPHEEFDTIEQYLEISGRFDEERESAICCIREFITSLETLVEKGDDDI